MSASRAEEQAVFDGWLERLKKIDHQLNWAMIGRRILTSVRDALIEKDRLREHPHSGWFLISYADVYWDSQAMVVRRLADVSDDRTHSLPSLIRRMRRNIQILTRARFIGIASEGSSDPTEIAIADARFTDAFGAGARTCWCDSPTRPASSPTMPRKTSRTATLFRRWQGSRTQMFTRPESSVPAGTAHHPPPTARISPARFDVRRGAGLLPTPRRKR